MWHHPKFALVHPKVGELLSSPVTSCNICGRESSIWNDSILSSSKKRRRKAQSKSSSSSGNILIVESINLVVWTSVNPSCCMDDVGLSDVNTTVHQYEYYRSTYRHQNDAVPQWLRHHKLADQPQRTFLYLEDLSEELQLHERVYRDLHQDYDQVRCDRETIQSTMQYVCMHWIFGEDESNIWTSVESLSRPEQLRNIEVHFSLM